MGTSRPQVASHAMAMPATQTFMSWPCHVTMLFTTTTSHPQRRHPHSLPPSSTSRQPTHHLTHITREPQRPRVVRGAPARAQGRHVTMPDDQQHAQERRMGEQRPPTTATSPFRMTDRHYCHVKCQQVSPHPLKHPLFTPH
jgi:hypothetical protein